MMKEKKINHINVFEIKAGKHILCAHPAIWELEAAADVYYNDNRMEIQYFSITDLEEDSWQVMSKSMEDIKDDEDPMSYLIVRWNKEEQALASPYGPVFARLQEILHKIAGL